MSFRVLQGVEFWVEIVAYGSRTGCLRYGDTYENGAYITGDAAVWLCTLFP